ncbi:MAG: inner membrane CreD family protein, partial [Bacteroidales bacterium]|nr:inner membrane CreD family protein [Bacteroidales bacterium]
METKEDYSFMKYLIVVVLVGLLWACLQIVNVQVDDRENYMRKTIDEVGSTWSLDQRLAGPVIVYDRTTYDTLSLKSSKGKDSLVVRKRETTNEIYPEVMDVKCDVDSKNLHRAIYDVSVYSTKAMFSGFFRIPEEVLGQQTRNFRVKMSVSDLKGIYEQLYVTLDTVRYQLNPNPKSPSSSVKESSSDDVVEMVINEVETRTEVLDSPITLKKGMLEVPFSALLAVKGSNSLSFYPVGDATTVEVKSSYNNPSF